VLEQRYGPISALVSRHDELAREASLVDHNGVMRTYTVTFFPKQKAPQFSHINRTIASGKPIGRTFRERGYTITKRGICSFTLEAPAWIQRAFGTREKRVAARAYDFYAAKGRAKPALYGTVIEVYSPDFMRAGKASQTSRTHEIKGKIQEYLHKPMCRE
jgi:hypothetical protein